MGDSPHVGYVLVPDQMAMESCWNILTGKVQAMCFYDSQVDMVNRLSGYKRRFDTLRVGDKGTQHVTEQTMSLITIVMAMMETRCYLRIISQVMFQIKIWTFEIVSGHLGKTRTGIIISI